MFNSLYHSISVEIFEESRVVFPASIVSIDLRPQKSAKFPQIFCGKFEKSILIVTSFVDDPLYFY
jgi:hypothetical protein